MRGTGGNDVNFAMDVPKVDSPDVADLRAKGAIIFAVATADNVGGASSPTGPEKPKTIMPVGNLKYAQWGGQPCNPYDTDARAARHEQRLGRLGRGEPGDLLDLRTELGARAKARRRATAS